MRVTCKIYSFLDELIETISLASPYTKSIDFLCKKSILNDTLSTALVRNLKHDFTRLNVSNNNTLGILVRVRYFGQEMAHFIEENEQPLVINLGCVVNAHYQRLGEYHKKALFYKLDLPDVIDLRKRLMLLNQNNLCVSYLVLEEEWIKAIQIKYHKSQILFATEGLLMYFKKVKIRNLCIDLARHFSFSNTLVNRVNEWTIGSNLRRAILMLKSGFNNDRESWSRKLGHVKTQLFASEVKSLKNHFLKHLLLKIYCF